MLARTVSSEGGLTTPASPVPGADAAKGGGREEPVANGGTPSYGGGDQGPDEDVPF